MNANLKRIRRVIGAVAVALFLPGACDQDASREPRYSDTPTAPGAQEYTLGVNPLYNPKHLFEVYSPLADYLTAHVPDARFRLEASRDFADFEKKLYGGRLHFAIANPYQAILSLNHGARIFGKLGDDEIFRGVILVRRNSGIERVTDLKGKSVSYPAPTALVGTLAPQYYLHTHGLDVNRDVASIYVGSQESSIMSVSRGFTAAGATWTKPWRTFQRRYPEEAGSLMEKWWTDPLPSNALVARNDVPPAVVDKVAALLFSLQDSGEGRKLLKAIPLARFEPASSETYEPVREFLRRFSAEVRPLEGFQ